MFGKGKKKDSNKQLTVWEMRELENDMDVYIMEIERYMRPMLDKKLSDLDSLQQEAIRRRYRAYLSQQYTTPLMLEYVNHGKDGMAALVRDIVKGENGQIEKMQDIGYIGGAPDFAGVQRS